MSSELLARSATGASVLIFLQTSSKALTFIVNQILLRFLTPAHLGAATQLDLISISVLYFSRESIRVALQRQTPDKSTNTERRVNDKSRTVDTDRAVLADSNDYCDKDRQLQEAFDLSFGAITIGLPLTCIFFLLYARRIDRELLSMPFFHESITLYAIATILELCHEPLFAASQQKLLYTVRASSEFRAAFLKCCICCLSAVWADRHGLDIGVLPFALGQISYALMLLLNYSWKLRSLLRKISWTFGIDGLSKLLTSSTSKPMLHVIAVLYAQSICKQFLTSGDSYVVAAFTTLSAQGAYALASNYGGLFARLFFQPLEEASRSLLARLLPARGSHSDGSSVESSQKKRLHEAIAYLTTIVRCYSLVSLFMLTLAPPLALTVLRLVAGSQWRATEAPSVLAAYCYYIPLLAYNGIFEAYVSAVADAQQLNQQSILLVFSSIIFSIVGYVFLKIFDLGAKGLVMANALIMVGRIMWSWRFMQRDLLERGGTLMGKALLPRTESVAVTAAGLALMLRIKDWLESDLEQALIMCGIIGLSGLVVLGLERDFLWQSYKILKLK